jgi:O-antigen/teichoic acid export membrane protein
MDLSPRQLIRNVFHFGSGEFLGRVFSVCTIVLMGHLYGVAIVGVYGLAITVITNQVPVIDFGLKHIGARLMARFPDSGGEIIRRVQRRRLTTALLALPFVLLYAAVANLPPELKLFLLAYSSVGMLYAFSLDWAAWGSESLFLAGMIKAVIPACILSALLLALRFGHLLPLLVAGNLAGYLLQTFIFLVWWRRQRNNLFPPSAHDSEILQSMEWRRTSVMGLAWIANLAFNSIDMLMLGVLSNPQQVGLYSASYRILNQVLIAYYLLTGVLYPQFARQGPMVRHRMLRIPIFSLLFLAGLGLALPIAYFRSPLLGFVFGKAFLGAAPFLLLLACCIPLDFLASYLSNAYIAWNLERSVLFCAVIAAASNVALNFYGIPRYGAMAAAVNTVISYLVYLAVLSFSSRKLATGRA